MQKLVFRDSGSVYFFFWKNPGESISKNAKWKDHVSFVYQALFF